MAYNFAGVVPSHRALCGVRLDNSLSFSSPTPFHLPTTCFNDVVLVPLASWIFLAALFLWFIPFVVVPAYRRGNRSAKGAVQRYDYPRREGQVQPWISRWGKTSSGFSVLYMLLIVAAELMNVLQIVRLALVKPSTRGVGLLPFNLASILILFVLIHLRLPSSVRPWTIALSLVYWVPLLVFTAIQLRVLALMMGPEPRTGSEYLDSDQQIDVGVMIGLYAIFVIVEACRLPGAFRERSRRVDEGEVKVGSEEGLQGAQKDEAWR